MLGKDYADHGGVGYCTVSNNLTCAISIGAKQKLPSLTHDAFFKQSNEDALLAVSNNNYIFMAVADAHFGNWASHTLMTGLAEQSHNVSDISSIYIILDNLHDLYSDSTQISETTLIAISINRKTRVCEGISIGDSTAMIINNNYTKRINSKTHCYTNPNNSASMYEAMADEFSLQLSKNDRLVLFTDGVDECHYGHPETSINDEKIHDIYKETSDDSMKFTTQLAKLALSGVNNNPGGQDNIAIVSLFI